MFSLTIGRSSVVGMHQEGICYAYHYEEISDSDGLNRISKGELGIITKDYPLRRIPPQPHTINASAMSLGTHWMQLQPRVSRQFRRRPRDHTSGCLIGRAPLYILDSRFLLAFLCYHHLHWSSARFLRWTCIASRCYANGSPQDNAIVL